MALAVRRLVPTDAPAFRALRLRGLREHPQAFTSSYEEDVQIPLQVTATRLDSPRHTFWGAFQGAELVGMLGLERETRAKARHKGTVVAMYVAPEASRQGVARDLLLALLQQARAEGLASLVLTVTEGNAAALKLYERAGFRSFGLEPCAIRLDGRAYGKIHMVLLLSENP